MTNLSSEICRREFLVALSAVATSLSSGLILSTALAEQQDVDPLKLALLVEASTNEVMRSKGYVPRFRAISSALTSSNLDAAEILKTANRISLEQEQFQSSRLIGRLRGTFASSSEALNVFGWHRSVLDVQGFDGVVDRAAGIALLLGNIAARSSKQSELNDYLNDLPVYGSSRATRAAITGMFTSSIPRLRALASDPGIESIGVRPTTYPTNALLKMLPLNAKALAEKVLEIGFDNKHKELQEQLVFRTKSVISAGKQAFETESGHLRDEQTRYSSARQRVVTVTHDLHAVTTIGAFILGTALGDRAAEQEFTTGMQVASFGLNAGLMMSTGGVGCIALVAGLASGLQGMRGDGKQSDAVKELASELAQQLLELRQEMLSRFDRLENLQIEALDILLEVSRDLRQLNLSLRQTLNKLQVQVAEFEHYIKVQYRQTSLDNFSAAVQNAKAAIQDANDPAYNAEKKNSLLFSFLNHAIDIAADVSFVSDSGASIANTVRSCERLDLAISHMGRAAHLLKLKHVPNFDRNPIEWARGVQSYMELHSSLNFESPTVNDRAMEAWKIGRSMRDSFAALCTPENVGIAINSYRSACEELRDHLLRSLQLKETSEKHTLRVGRPPWPQQWNVDELLNWPKKHDIPRIFYLIERGPLEAYWKIAGVDQFRDPFFIARSLGAISLQETARRPLTYTKSTGEPNVKIVQQFGEQKDYTVLDRHNAVIERISGISISRDFQEYAPAVLPVTFNAFDFSSTPQGVSPTNKVAAFWNKLYDLCDDKKEILAWVMAVTAPADDDAQLTPVQRFDDVAASFALYMTLVSWAVTDRIDDPWVSGISSQMLRSIDDIQKELNSLAAGISRSRSPYLVPSITKKPGPEESFLSTEDPADYRKAKFLFSPEEAKRDLRSWRDLNVFLNYNSLANTVLSNHLNKTVRDAELIRKQVAVHGQPIAYVDRMMSKFTAFLATREE
ncbi:hypothetical protein [Bradyrhizobium sp. ARR65]|uniref:hypothetical protein n=1 Tax=Bradyrhizobium sp. ARR65 TaxID=1040989 RepID=UPI000467C3A5|nr:hypothetical protein [Bradyrhizobium sp. ARR65]